MRFTAGLTPTDPWWVSEAGAKLKLGMKQLIAAWYHGRLPFERGMDATSEYPYAVTHLLSTGGIRRVR